MLWVLRPLILFVMAFPTLILVALLDLRNKRRDAETSRETPPAETPRLLSAFGTWRADPDGGKASAVSDPAGSTDQKRAA